MITVLVFGTFDRLHKGHVRFLGEARRYGDRLVALVSRDEFVRAFKGKEPRYPQDERCRRLVARGLVDEACLSDPVPGSYESVLRVDPEVICLGYDQDRLRESLAQWLAGGSLDVRVEVLEYFPVPREELS